MFCLEILEILDPKLLLHCGILEILDIDYLLLQWDTGDPKFVLCGKILEILDPD